MARANRWIRITRNAVAEAKYEVTDLIEDNEYQFRVSAENKAGVGPEGLPSETVLAANPWGKPGKPGVPDIKTTDKKQITLAWKPPKNDGGSPITGYIVEYKAEGAYKWLRASDDSIPDTAHVVKGLKEDMIYEFRIAAENKAGMGPFSENTMPVKAQEKIGKQKSLINTLIIHKYSYHSYILLSFINTSIIHNNFIIYLFTFIVEENNEKYL